AALPGVTGVRAASPRLSGAGRGQEGGQVEPAEAVGVDDRIDLGDLAVEDGEGDDRDGPLGRGDDDSCATVDQRRLNHRRRLSQREGLPGDGGGTGEHYRGAAALDAAVGAHHDLGVEERYQRIEVATAGGGEERADHLALAG